MVATTVVVVTGGHWSQTTACLDAVRATLRAGDELLCVVPGHLAVPARAVPAGVRRVPAPPGADLAAARRAGLVAARHDLVAFLDDDLLVAPHWLDPLLRALADPAVGAAGPRSNRVAGPQMLPEVDGAAEAAGSVRAAVRGVAQRLRQEAAGTLTEVGELSRLAVLLRRADVPPPVGPPGAPATDPADAVPGARVVAGDSYVHHLAGPGCLLRRNRRPLPEPAQVLLSAVVIARDEADGIAAAVTAARAVADEVVVYDTGSTDATVALAAQAGARVVQGFWDDHFGAARNRALAHSSGEWVLSVDADEIVACPDPEALRRQLATTRADGLLVTIDSVEPLGLGLHSTTVGCRLFRRPVCRWAGRLHEQVVDRELGGPPPTEPAAGLVLHHDGYTLERLEGRDKGRRNLDLALAAVAAADADSFAGRALALANLVRARLTVGDLAEALDTAEEALAAGLVGLSVRHLAAPLVHSCLGAARWEDAERWLDRLQTAGELPARVDFLRARLLAGRGDTSGALALWAGLPEEATDAYGGAFRHTETLTFAAGLYVARGEPSAAADLLCAGLRAGVLDWDLTTCLDVLRAAGRGPADLAAAVPPPLWRHVVAVALRADPANADDLLEAFWQRRPADLAVLAAAGRVAARLPVLRALEWSARLRAAAPAAPCPLVQIASDPSRPARDRVVALSVAVQAWDDPRAWAALPAALAAVPDAAAADVLAELRVLAPTVAAAVEWDGAAPSG
ncbi:MAG: glycosyltransferase [Actinomycetota bacterium]